MNITIIAGARPNFMKIAPIIKALEKRRLKGRGKAPVNSFIKYRLVHTGQHYDRNMSESFFSDLNIPDPDINLGCGGGSQAEQTAAIMVSFEKELLSNPTDLVMVVGDVTSTMACSIVAKKLNTRVAHVEAGIRSYDMTMPEEINRMVTDILSDYFFTTSELAGENLRKTGITGDRIFFVGNVMIDTLLANRDRFKKPAIWDEAGLKKKDYIVITLHRPNNVDDPLQLRRLVDTISESSRNLPLIFPIHPRTAKILYDSKIIDSPIDNVSPSRPIKLNNLYFIPPLGYLEFNYLVENSKAVITDSGGITEETTVMGVPCITIRDNTERPETVTVGTNELIGTDPSSIRPALNKLFSGKWKKGKIPELWDGKSAERIVEKLLELL